VAYPHCVIKYKWLLQIFNTTLYSWSIRLHVLFKNDQPSSVLITVIQKRVYFTTVACPSNCVVQGTGLQLCSWWDHEFEFHWGHGCLFLMFVVCCVGSSWTTGECPSLFQDPSLCILPRVWEWGAKWNTHSNTLYIFLNLTLQRLLGSQELNIKGVIIQVKDIWKTLNIQYFHSKLLNVEVHLLSCCSTEWGGGLVTTQFQQ